MSRLGLKKVYIELFIAAFFWGGASIPSECINLVPVITIILTIVLLHTMPKSYQVLGALVIVAGMCISKVKRKI